MFSYKKVTTLALFLLISFGINHSANAVSCGTTLTSNTNMNGDLTGCNTGFTIGNDFITLDCQGHTVSGINTNYGIYSNAHQGVTVKNCNFQNFANGIFLSSNTNDVLMNNTITNSSVYGIFLGTSGSNSITGNTIVGGSTNVGIALTQVNSLGPSNDNIVSNNIIKNNALGIWITSSSGLNIIRINKITDNAVGIRLTSSSGNSMINNLLSNPINAKDSNNNDWNTAKVAGTNVIGGPYLGGNFWSDYNGKDDGSGTGVHAISGDGLGDTQVPFTEYGNISTGGDNLPLIFPCGLTITQNTTLPTDLSCSGTAITIGADAIQLDCNNHKIMGTGTGDGVFVGSQNNFTIKNCFIKNFNNGIRVNPSTPVYYSELTNNTAVENKKMGFYLIFFFNSSLNYNTANYNKKNGFQFTADGFNVINSNTANSNLGDGFSLAASTHANNIFFNNSAYNNSQGFYTSSSGNRYELNKADANTDGFFLDLGATEENVTSNMASNNQNGFSVQSLINNLTNNQALSNQNGYIFSSTSGKNLVANNLANNNNIVGFSVSSTKNNFTNNTVSASFVGFFLASTSSYNLFINNSATGNFAGFILLSSKFNKLISNSANGNLAGFGLSSSANYNNFTSNTASNNTNIGFSLFDLSNGNTIYSNIVQNNNYDGINLTNSYNNTIYNNYFSNSVNARDDGINIWNKPKTAGNNIINGPYLGGNFWSDYLGSDTDFDLLGDTLVPYNSNGLILFGGDNHPLVNQIASIFMIDINHASTFWGIPMDSSNGTPAWHIRAAIAHLLDKSQFVSANVPGGMVVDNMVPILPQLNNYNLHWTSSLLANADPNHPGAISLYNNVVGPDYCEARDHLIAAGGIGNDGLPWHDSNNDCIIDNPPTTPIRFFIRSTNPRRTLGMTLANAINTEFGATVVSITIGDIGQFTPIIFDTQPADDWDLYTGAISVPAYPQTAWLCSQYSSTYIPNPPGSTTANYVLYSNTNFDNAVLDSSGVCKSPISQTDSLQAQQILGDTIANIPVWSK